MKVKRRKENEQEEIGEEEEEEEEEEDGKWKDEKWFKNLSSLLPFNARCIQ